MDRLFAVRPMVGFVMIAWDAENTWDCQYSTASADNPVPLNMLPEFAADSIRRTTAIEDANRVVRGQPGYVWSKPPEPDGAA